jgi:MFS family permease
MRAYVEILRAPHFAPLLAAMVLARLPIGIDGIAIVLFLRSEDASFALAGATAGALALGSGVGAPIGARLIDRFGTRVLLVLALGHATGLLGLVALGSAGAPGMAIVALALGTGITMPPVSSVLRTLYPRLLDGGLVQGAFALDAALTEAIFVAGPLLTAALIALVAPAAALVLSAAAVSLGVLAFLAQLPAEHRREPAADRAGGLGALRSAGIRTLVASMLPVGVAFGAVEVALPAFAEDHGAPEVAGVLLAVWALGSAAGALAYGARPRRVSLAETHVRFATLLPLGFLPLFVADAPFVMALLLVPAGVLIAPLIASRNELAGEVAPPGAETEALTWPLTALVGGVAIGAAGAGVAIEAGGWRAAVVVAVGAAALGALAALAGRGTLRGAAERGLA